jgi:hypothetical protein
VVAAAAAAAVVESVAVAVMVAVAVAVAAAAAAAVVESAVESVAPRTRGSLAIRTSAARGRGPPRTRRSVAMRRQEKLGQRGSGLPPSRWAVPVPTSGLSYRSPSGGEGRPRACLGRRWRLGLAPTLGAQSTAVRRGVRAYLGPGAE